MSSRLIINKRLKKSQWDIFFRDLEDNKPQQFKLNVISQLETINKYYLSLQNINFNNTTMDIKDCYALRLANAIIEKISNNDINVSKDGSFSEHFYSDLANSLKESNNSDEELIIIYLKQMMNILKSCGLVVVKNKKGIVTQNLKGKEIYFKLLNSFWNQTNWQEIFPSSPELAEKLFNVRETFLEFLEGFYTKINIESLAKDLFDMTEIADKNDSFAISFIDFYLITWLRHFGIIEYIESENIYILLTDYGRNILKAIQKL